MSHIPGQKEQREADIALLKHFHTLEAAKTVQVDKDTRVTPFFVSHSAADAYMFLANKVIGPSLSFSHSRASASALDL